MEVKNRAGVIEQMTREQYDALEASGHAKHLTIVSDTDYVPEELTLPGGEKPEGSKPADPEKGKGKSKADEGK